MSSRLSESGQATGLVLVGLMILAIPAGLAVAQGLSDPAAHQQAIPTITPPPLTSSTPTETPTDTATETPTPTPTPTLDGDGNNTDRDGTSGQTHYVNAGVEPSDVVTSGEDCSAADYTTIQAAVDAADPGDTVAVCPGTYAEHVEVTTADLTITAADRISQAAGDVTIRNANESAVWINASGVTLQGFNINVGEGADYAIEVGGKEAVIESNTVDSPGVGIFLSDGHTETGKCRLPGRESGIYNEPDCDGGPPVDPDLGAATRGRILNNTVSAGMLRLWVDADQTVVQNNFVTDRETSENTEDYSECKTNRQAFRTCPTRFNDSIVSSGNGTLIRGNTIRLDKKPTGVFHREAGIMIGKTPTKGHNIATNNTVVANTINSNTGLGIKTRNVTAGTNIRNNPIAGTSLSIRVADEATIRNNPISNPSDKGCSGGMRVASFKMTETQNYNEKDVLIINNTIGSGPEDFCLRGMLLLWDAVVKGNTIRNFAKEGVVFGVCHGGGGRVLNNQITGSEGGVVFHNKAGGSDGPCIRDMEVKPIEVLNNQITDNRHGIRIENETGVNPSKYEIHENFINNNRELGIYNENDSVIVDATNNIWACGGPSSGFNPLADPYTGRLANGSGDLISAGNGSTRNGHPISNVHFDPFQELTSCSGSQPTPTSSPTPTPTPTATPTAPSAPPAVSGNGTGGAGGSGTGGTGGSGTSGDGNGTGGEMSSGETSEGTPLTGTPPPEPSTPTGTPPETPTETPTISPTPKVEPGFDAITLIVAVAMLGSVIALRRRTQAESETSND